MALIITEASSEVKKPLNRFEGCDSFFIGYNPFSAYDVTAFLIQKLLFYKTILSEKSSETGGVISL